MKNLICRKMYLTNKQLKYYKVIGCSGSKSCTLYYLNHKLSIEIEK